MFMTNSFVYFPLSNCHWPLYIHFSSYTQDILVCFLKITSDIKKKKEPHTKNPKTKPKPTNQTKTPKPNQKNPDQTPKIHSTLFNSFCMLRLGTLRLSFLYNSISYSYNLPGCWVGADFKFMSASQNIKSLASRTCNCGLADASCFSSRFPCLLDLAKQGGLQLPQAQDWL